MIVKVLINNPEKFHKVSNVKYAAVSFTMERRGWCFALSERFEMSALVTTLIWREGRRVTTYQKVANAVVITPL